MPINYSNPNVEIYPGSFQSKYNKDFNEINFKKNKSIIKKPEVNIIDNGELVKVEILIPGVNREEFFIEGKGNKLSICVFHSQQKNANNKFNLKEFEYCKFEREILLPDNVDLSFVSASYEGGILNIHIPKSNMSAINETTMIAVY